MGDLEVPVFTPTAEEFRDFTSYVVKMQSLCPAGAAIVKPPKGWRPRANMSYNDIYELPVRKPIKQHFIGSKGVYFTEHHVLRSRRLFSFIEEAEDFAREHDRTPENATDFETERQYWRNVTYRKPTYGADLPGSLFDDAVCKQWNLNHLNTILDLCPGIPGVSSPYLYVGQYSSTFCFHTEDTDLYGINYLHYGAPKIWYAVPISARERFEAMCRQEYPNLAQGCSEFLRHKQCLIGPDVLKKYGIPFGRVAHKQGTFMVVFPGVYHQGYNAGFNIAESINFATLSWLRIGSRSRPCLCRKDSVRLDFGALDRALFPGKYGRSFVRMQRELESDRLRKRALRMTNSKKKKRRRLNDGYDDDGEEEDSFDTAYSNPRAVAREIMSEIFAKSMKVDGEDPNSEFDKDGFRYPLKLVLGEEGLHTKFVRVDALDRPCGPIHGPIFDPVMSVVDHVIDVASQGRKRKPPPLEPNPMSEYKIWPGNLDEHGEIYEEHLKEYGNMLAMEQEMLVARTLAGWIHHCWKELIDVKRKQKLSLRLSRCRRLFAKLQDVMFERHPESFRAAQSIVEEVVTKSMDDTGRKVSASIVDDIIERATNQEKLVTNYVKQPQPQYRPAMRVQMLATPKSVSVPRPQYSVQRYAGSTVVQIEQWKSQKLAERTKNYANSSFPSGSSGMSSQTVLSKIPKASGNDVGRWARRRFAKDIVTSLIDNVCSSSMGAGPSVDAPESIVLSDVSNDSDTKACVWGKNKPVVPFKPAGVREKYPANVVPPTSFASYRFDSKSTWQKVKVARTSKQARVAKPARRRPSMRKLRCTSTKPIPDVPKAQKRNHARASESPSKASLQGDKVNSHEQSHSNNGITSKRDMGKHRSSSTAIPVTVVSADVPISVPTSPGQCPTHSLQSTGKSQAFETVHTAYPKHPVIAVYPKSSTGLPVDVRQREKVSSTPKHVVSREASSSHPTPHLPRPLPVVPTPVPRSSQSSSLPAPPQVLPRLTCTPSSRPATSKIAKPRRNAPRKVNDRTRLPRGQAVSEQIEKPSRSTKASQSKNSPQPPPPNNKSSTSKTVNVSVLNFVAGKSKSSEQSERETRLHRRKELANREAVLKEIQESLACTSDAEGVTFVTEKSKKSEVIERDTRLRRHKEHAERKAVLKEIRESLACASDGEAEPSVTGKLKHSKLSKRETRLLRRKQLADHKAVLGEIQELLACMSDAEAEGNPELDTSLCSYMPESDTECERNPRFGTDKEALKSI